MADTQQTDNARNQAPVRPEVAADDQRVYPQVDADPSIDAGTYDASVEEDTINAYRAIEEGRRKKRNKRIAIGAVLGGLALLGIVGFTLFGMQNQAAEEAEQTPTAVVVRSDYEASVTASGSTQPENQVVVSPEVDGIIESLLVAEGDTVAKGDVLLTIKNDTLDKTVADAEQGVRQAENGVSAAQHSVQSANNAYATAQSTYDSVFARKYENQEVADAAGAEATAALESAQQAVDSANLELDNANIALSNAREALDQARQTAGKRTVVAPASGVVVSMNAKVGASIGHSTGSVSAENVSGTLMTIADLTQMRVAVQVNEVDINKVQVGQAAEVTFSSIENLVLNAQVEHIAALATGSSSGDNMGGGVVTYEVDLVIPEPDPRVKPGMTARVKIVSERLVDVLTVPAGALAGNGDGTGTVSVVVDGDVKNAQMRTVNILAQDSTTAAIEGDIAEGDMVLLAEDGSDTGDAALTDTAM